MQMFCSRSRLTNLLLNTTRPSYQQYTSAGVPTTSYVYGSIQGTAGTKKEIADNPHKNFYQRRSRGEIIMGDLSLSDLEQTVVDADFVIHGNSSWGYRHCWGDYACYTRAGVPDRLSISSTRDQAAELALVRAYAKANEPSIVSGEILSDVGATLGMLRSPFKGASTLAKRIRKRAFDRNRARLRRGLTSDLPKCLADTWLEYRYGWRPLIGDISTAILLTQNNLKKLKEGRVVRTSEVSNAKLSIDHTFTSGMPSLDSVHCVGSHEINVRASAGLICELTYVSQSEKLAAALGIDATALPRTAWEVIPFSFVVDWFVNVGDWIAAVTPNPNLRILASWVTASCTEVKDYTMTGSAVVSGVSNTGLMVGASRVKEKTLQRSCRPVLPLTPRLTLRCMGWSQALDSIGLLYQNVISDIKLIKH